MTFFSQNIAFTQFDSVSRQAPVYEQILTYGTHFSPLTIFAF